MQNILSKFDDIEIKNNSRIDQDDQEFCELFNQIYSETLECYKNTLNSLITLYNKQRPLVKDSYELSISTYGDFSINGVIKDIHNIKERFISKITYSSAENIM
jgi:hypothetical protein